MAQFIIKNPPPIMSQEDIIEIWLSRDSQTNSIHLNAKSSKEQYPIVLASISKEGFICLWDIPKTIGITKVSK